MTPPSTPASLWTSEEIVAATGGRLVGPPFAAGGVSIDSRDTAPGDLFVALRAERDGHDFVPAALAAGAVGALVERSTGTPGIVVPDALAALAALGERARRRAGHALRGAVTGSVGKTSVTQAVYAGLTRASEMGAGPGHGSVKSFNNHIGVPLTLARMPPDTRRAVFEIGMNHAGEIAPLSALVRPHVAAITTVEAVHVENFADGESGVAAAKAEVFAGLERGGAAILNADNRWFDYLKGEARRAGARLRTFGAVKGADAGLTRFSPARGGASVEARIDGKAIEFPIRQSAPHWGLMSLCAVLMLQALDVDLETAVAALAAFEPLEGRGAERRVRLRTGDFTLIDESYNASPVSTAAALAALAGRRGRRLAVLTDMLELGDAAEALHAGLAPSIAAACVAQVYCAGPAMRALFEALDPARRGAWAPTAEDLAPLLAAAAAPGDVIMVKGSKASRASHLVAALAALDGER